MILTIYTVWSLRLSALVICLNKRTKSLNVSQVIWVEHSPSEELRWFSLFKICSKSSLKVKHSTQFTKTCGSWKQKPKKCKQKTHIHNHGSAGYPPFALLNLYPTILQTALCPRRLTTTDCVAQTHFLTLAGFSQREEPGDRSKVVRERRWIFIPLTPTPIPQLDSGCIFYQRQQLELGSLSSKATPLAGAWLQLLPVPFRSERGKGSQHITIPYWFP